MVRRPPENKLLRVGKKKQVDINQLVLRVKNMRGQAIALTKLCNQFLEDVGEPPKPGKGQSNIY